MEFGKDRHRSGWVRLTSAACSCRGAGRCSQFGTNLACRQSSSLFCTSFSLLVISNGLPFLPADLSASFQVPLPEAGARSLACCCILVGHKLWTAELTQRITIGGHCWTLTNIINTQVVAAGLFFKFTLIKISFIFKT